MTNPLKLAAEARESAKRRYGPGVQLLLELAEAIEQLTVKLEKYEVALNKIAVWGDGPEVTPSFDCPWASTIARRALGERRGG
jgi:hypothetical protein